MLLLFVIFVLAAHLIYTFKIGLLSALEIVLYMTYLLLSLQNY